jgi:hypothetical protein
MDEDLMTDRHALEREKKLAKLKQLKERQQDGLAERQATLADALERLSVHLERLEERLQPVLRDPEPGEPVGPTPHSIPTSPLAGFLTGVAGQAHALGNRVAELIERVDL